MAKSLYDIRLEKRDNWAKRKNEKYPGRFEKSHTAKEINELSDGTDVSFAGRIITIRDLGKISFVQIRDHTSSVQVSFNVKELGIDNYKFFLSNLDIGDFVGVNGNMFTTKTSMKTISATDCSLLSKSLRSLPEKHGGLNNQERRVRQRYLDLLANQETWDRFEKRNKLIKFIRNFLEVNQFSEVETPALQPVATGANARPFITHHNSMDIDLYLRIAHEPYLKRLMVGGYERIFEIGKCFRNEGIESSRLQEFTLLEYYAAYWDYKDNMKFMQRMIQGAVKDLTGSYVIEYQGKTIDFSGDWEVVTFRELLLKDTGIDINIVTDLETLKKELVKKGLELELELELDSFVGYATLLDEVYKKFSRHKLINPVFVTEQPSELVCLSRRSDHDPTKLDLFQLVVNSWELIKAYSELVDPVEQSERFANETRLQNLGDEAAMSADEEYVLCMEYGMPIMSGVGLGIDRLLGIITDVTNIRDVIYFPPVRPINRSELNNLEKEETQDWVKS